MSKHEDKIAALRADEEGKPIQCRSKRVSEDSWGPAIPSWDFDNFDYRPKPEPLECWVTVKLSKPEDSINVYHSRLDAERSCHETRQIIHMREVTE